MQRTCPQCGNVINTSSQFCTNCGASMPPAQAYRQSWETPPVSNPAQVPPWAQAQEGMYQPQQMADMNPQNSGGSLGFGGQGDTQANKLLKLAGMVILGAILLFIVCIALAIVIPIPDVQTFFVIIAILLIVIPWIIYRRIKRAIRRTMGGFGRFL